MNWHNVNRKEPCPVCHKTDWCNLSNDGMVAICHRVESARPANGGGWIHRLRDGHAGCVTRPGTPATTLDFGRIHATYDADPILVEGLATTLGVDDEALKAMDVRFNAMDCCWSFPMRDAEGKVVGLRFREFNGSRKWSARGSKDGLFVGLGGLGGLVVVEGASDAAALMSAYLMPGAWRRPPLVVGRSSCQTGAGHLRALMRRVRPRTVTIVADNDEPGIKGANLLVRQLGVSCRVVIVPHPHKDVREWYLAGKLTPKVFEDIVSAQRWQ